MQVLRSGLTLVVLASLGFAATPRAEERSAPAADGERFYFEQVLPRLAENGCPACHAVGYLRPNLTRYDDMLRRLAIGDSPTNNAVIYKIANLRSIAPDRPNHPGGQRCANLESEPCVTVMKWWSVEFGDTGAKP